MPGARTGSGLRRFGLAGRPLVKLAGMMVTSNGCATLGADHQPEDVRDDEADEADHPADRHGDADHERAEDPSRSTRPDAGRRTR